MRLYKTDIINDKFEKARQNGTRMEYPLKPPSIQMMQTGILKRHNDDIHKPNIKLI